MNALIVIDVHAKDVVDTLNKRKIDNITTFDWISQLRYYWISENDQENKLDYANNTHDVYI